MSCNLLEYFDKIYCVNLERRLDRWETVSQEFSKYGIEAERFLAVDGSTHDWSNIDYNPVLLKGEIGLLETHINIIKDAKLNDYRRILIFEDDAEFDSEFENVESYLESVPQDWDMLYLAGNHRYGLPPKKVNEKIIKLNKTFTTHGIAINQSIYDDILELIEKREKQIDVYYADIQLKFNVYGFYPNFVFQAVGHSDIQDRTVNYYDVLLSRNFKLFDVNFPHTEFTTDHQKSDYVKWDRNYLETTPYDTVVITDSCMLEPYETEARKIGMLMEPRAINQLIYEAIAKPENNDKFDKILTYDKILLETSPKFEFYPHCGCWIQPIFQKIYPKSKLVSIIASDKNYTLGHTLRHEVVYLAKMHGIQLDSFGKGYTPIDNKINGLADYAFSMVIENSKIDYYFTEKLMDAFVTGSIPIYWGCPSIGKFFNLDGMIIFDDVSELPDILNSLSLEKYNSMMEAVKENFNLAKKYLIAEDWLYKTNNNIFK